MEALAWVVGIVGTLFLLFRFPRQSLTSFIFVAVIAAAIGGYFYLSEQIKKNKIAKVKGAIIFDSIVCNRDFPLLIAFSNGTNEFVDRVSFAVMGHIEGYSEALYDSGFGGYSSDRIIAPNERWALCWSLPRAAYGASEQRIASHPPHTLVWTLKNVHPTFRVP